MHTALTAAFANDLNGLSSPHLLDCSYQTIPASALSGKCLMLTAGISSSIYFLKFMAQGVIPQNISSTEYYSITLTAYDQAAKALQVEGQIYQVQLSSVADVTETALLLDSNKAFLYF